MNKQQVKQWGMFEITLSGPKTGNPFVDVNLSVQFRYGNRAAECDGFYDGDGVYRVRFMPDTLGEWSYLTRSNIPELNGITGDFTCTAPESGSHGPVQVRNRFHFEYADGTPYYPVGTTCYVWNHQGDAMEEQTLLTLKTAPFNKIRMCVFPKHYDYNHNEPVYYPFEGSMEHGWDYTRFVPEFFRHLEKRIGNLRDLGVEADLILFHPYDRWGFSDMGSGNDDRYIKYVVARFAAHPNIWWSMANEYDLMHAKTMADWDRFFKLIQTFDPYQHLRSVHNCGPFYDYGKPWVTHCSIQRPNPEETAKWRSLYNKPVVVDECCYEGNINHGWGNITGQEMTHRFWDGFIRGGYVGHGETYVHPRDILWWSHGGVLHGESPRRIAFLRSIIEDGPREGIEPIDIGWDSVCGGRPGEYYLIYYGIKQPSFKILNLPDNAEFRVEIIDTWEMTISEIPGAFKGNFRIELPGKPYIALRIQKIR
ncbi:MAG: DUF5605 domain-containing protein [Eubacteriales bacterium]